MDTRKLLVISEAHVQITIVSFVFDAKEMSRPRPIGVGCFMAILTREQPELRLVSIIEN